MEHLKNKTFTSIEQFHHPHPQFYNLEGISQKKMSICNCATIASLALVMKNQIEESDDCLLISIKRSRFSI